MLNFLRKLRIKEMNGKYFKYAIGEIILVVIGILIALSINNWSQKIKERKFERKMLSEIQNALQEDISYFETNIQRLSRLDSSISQFLKLIIKKVEFEDAMYNQPSQRSYFLLTGIIYQYNSGPYEALKSTGVDKITNDSLRKELIRLYDFEYPRHKEFIKYYDQDYKEQTDQFFNLMSQPFIETVDGEKRILRKLPADLLQKPEFLLLLDEMDSRAKIQLNGFLNFIPTIKRVEGLLAQELKTEVKNSTSLENTN